MPNEYFALKRTANPACEPLALKGKGSVKEWLRIDDDDTSQDGSLNRLIKAARERFEEQCDRALITQTWRMTFDRFPGLISVSPDYPGWEYLRLGSDGDPRVVRLARAPLQAVLQISYVDTSPATQTLDPSKYLVDVDSELGRVFPAYGQYWPVTQPQAGAVSITYAAGYANAAAVPSEIQDAMLAWIAHRWTRRDKPDDEYLERLFLPWSLRGYV